MLPPFDSLPLDPQGPPLNAWGLWGPQDQLGRLNLITPAAVKRGRDAIVHGEAVNLNLPLDVLPMSQARSRLEHEIVRREQCNDDIVKFNTQTSTQWDGLRHYPYQDFPSPGEYRYYGGATQDEMTRGSHCGIQNYVKRPITSRGHLLDIPLYAEKLGISLSPLDNTTPITLDLLRGCAEEQGLDFVPGDILLVRTGWTEAMFALDDEEKGKRRNRNIGVARGDDILRWHWDNGFAAVVSDTRAYEMFPHEHLGLSLHEVLLAGWGMPIGELFDLRQLAEVCRKHNQWSFLFTSMPLYIEGGVASPPNAQAIL